MGLFDAAALGLTFYRLQRTVWQKYSPRQRSVGRLIPLVRRKRHSPGADNFRDALCRRPSRSPIRRPKGLTLTRRSA